MTILKDCKIYDQLYMSPNSCYCVTMTRCFFNTVSLTIFAKKLKSLHYKDIALKMHIWHH